MIAERAKSLAAAELPLDQSWEHLCEALREYAERYALTDPLNAALYVQDALSFCNASAPEDEEELLERQAEAAVLRERWGDRYVGRFKHLPL